MSLFRARALSITQKISSMSRLHGPNMSSPSSLLVALATLHCAIVCFLFGCGLSLELSTPLLFVGCPAQCTCKLVCFASVLWQAKTLSTAFRCQTEHATVKMLRSALLANSRCRCRFFFRQHAGLACSTRILYVEREVHSHSTGPAHVVIQSPGHPAFPLRTFLNLFDC